MYTMIYTLDNFFIDQRESAAWTEPIIQIEIILTWKTPIIGRNAERKIIKFSFSVYGIFFFFFLTQTLWEQGPVMETRRRLSGEIKWENNVASPVRVNTFLGRREFRDSNSLFIPYLEITIKLSGTEPKFILQNASFWNVFREILMWTSLISVLSWWTRGGECERRKSICQIANLINAIRKSTWDHQNYKCGCKVLLNPITRKLQKGFGNMGKDLGMLTQHLNWQMEWVYC